MIKTIIFDLDDTLLDTWGQLVGPAAREACEAMVSKGLNCEVDVAIGQREQLFRAFPREDVYALLVDRFGVVAGADRQAVRDAGHQAYYHREVEPHIRLDDETRHLLSSLASSHCLHLVTSGHPETQNRKVTLLDIRHHFRSIHLVNRDQGQSKHQAFTRILEDLNHPPQQVLCVGDRPDREIRAGKALGMTCVRVVYGEYSHLEPIDECERAHFRIGHVRELHPILAN